MIGLGTTAMGYRRGGERLNTTLNTTRKKWEFIAKEWGAWGQESQ